MSLCGDRPGDNESEDSDGLWKGAGANSRYVWKKRCANVVPKKAPTFLETPSVRSQQENRNGSDHRLPGSGCLAGCTRRYSLGNTTSPCLRQVDQSGRRGRRCTLRSKRADRPQTLHFRTSRPVRVVESVRLTLDGHPKPTIAWRPARVRI